MINKTFSYLLLGLALLLSVSWFFSNILLYFIISIVISSILKPLTNYISNTQIFKIRFPRAIAVIVSFLIFMLVIASFVVLFIPLISDQIELLSNIEFESLVEKIRKPVDMLEAFLIRYRLFSGEEGFIVSGIVSGVQDLVTEVELGNLVNYVLTFTGNFFVGFLAVVFITFFLLYEMGTMRKKIISLIPNKYFEISIAAFNKIEKLFSNYLIGLLFQGFAIFSIASIGLSILGIKYALTIAVFAAIANLIPYLGPILGASFGILVGISTSTGLNLDGELLLLVIKIVSVFAIVQLTDNLFLQPIIFSKSVKAHPLEIFIVIFAGATLGKSLTGGVGGGIFGMMVAIPAYTILRVSAIELYTGYRKYNIIKI